MVLLAVNRFTQALWRQSLASYLLMMVLCLCLQHDYQSILVYAKEFVAHSAALSADAAVPTAGHALAPGALSSTRLEPSTVLYSGGEGRSAGPGTGHFTIPFPTKKPKLSPSRRRTSGSAPPVMLNPSNEPRFEAMISPVIDPSHPCYNFTIGNEKFQEFYSPGYPNFYPNDTECERVIRAPPGHQIHIEFRDKFHLEEATNCEYDYLEIRDGAYGYSTPLAKLCGPDFPREVTSRDRYLFVRFVSDDSIEYQGFRAVYTFNRMQLEKPEPPHDCRFNKSGVSGIIDNREIPTELTNYSITQDVSIDCMWNVTVAAGYKMYLNFKEYKLAHPNNCEANYIDIYGDKLSDLGRKQRFCGTQAEPVRSDGNHMNIRFFARPDALSNVQFEITFTAFREISNKEKCSTQGEFDCEDSTCIDASLKCDGVDNCKYRYDEDKLTTCAPGNQGVLNLNSQHMVIILIVFCALVFGMCASITISCWSKIEERRQRKREYKLRRSRETSMEVGLDRTMTITSLDRSTTGCAMLEHPDQASSSSGSRCRKIITANTIRPKSEILDEDGLLDGTTMAYYDSEENGCYVPDMEITSMHHPSTSHHHLVYPPSAERRPKQTQAGQPNGGGTLCAGHHLDSGDKYSPDTPTPPQMMLGSPNGPGGGQSPLVVGEYYPHAQQNQMERDSIRSGSECSIPPPPPPPSMSHFRNRLQQQQQQFRTLPLDASKLPEQGIMMMGDNHQSTLPYRHPQHMQQQQQQQQRLQSGPMTLSQQQLIIHQPGQHHPDCAQHKLHQSGEPTGYNPGPPGRRTYYPRPVISNNPRPQQLPPLEHAGNGGDMTGEMLNVDDVDEGMGIDEGDESGVGPSEHRSGMELNEVCLEEDMLTENDMYPSSNGRLPSATGSGPAMGQQQQHHPPQHYLMRGQSTLDEEDDSATSVPLTNSNAGYGSGGGPLTPGHRQPYYRSEAVIEMGAPDGAMNNSNAIRQGVAMR